MSKRVNFSGGRDTTSGNWLAGNNILCSGKVCPFGKYGFALNGANLKILF